MIRKCSTYGRVEKCVQNFSVGLDGILKKQGVRVWSVYM